MKQIWERYLDQIVRIDDITQLVIYTDSFRFWLANGLLDLADEYDIPASLQIIEEITDEEGMEIQQSLSYLPKSTLLAAFFSNRNPVIEELNSIFPLLIAPINYSGLSLVIHQNLADQYYLNHLQTDIHQAKEIEAKLREEINSSEKTFEVSSDEGTYFEAEIVSVASYPYYPKANHVLLPGTELIIDLVPSTLDGTIKVTGTIGSYVEEGELLDPFGKLDTPVELLVESGEIVDIRGNDVISRRLHQIIDLPYSTETVQLSIGIGLESELTGFIEHDRLIKNMGTISWISQEKTFLEFVIGEIDLNS